MNTNLLLKQARLSKGWTRPQVEEITNGEITVPSLTRWELGYSYPREDNRIQLARLYNMTLGELGLDQNHAIIGTTIRPCAPTTIEEAPMSEIMRRTLFANLGSKLASLIDTWPRRDYAYEGLQNEISRTLVEYNSVVAESPAREQTRRQAIKDMILVPIVLVIEMPTMSSRKTDTDTLLKHCAAGITACWYLRQGKDRIFADAAVNEYIKILSPLLQSQSEVYRKASAGLLTQSLMLKGSIAQYGENNSETAIGFGTQAISYSVVASNMQLQAFANRMMVQFQYHAKNYTQALSYALQAEALIRPGNLDRLTQSWIYSGLTYCQAYTGLRDDSVVSLKLAHDLFDPRVLPPIYMQYNQRILHNCMGITSLRNEDYKEAAKLFDEQITLGSADEAKLDRAKVEASRDDQARDMDLCIKYLTEGVTKAHEMGCKLCIGEASELYTILRRYVWPREDAVKKLGREHFGITK